jgi:hypothetical protein
MNVSGLDFSNNGIRTESQLKLHKVMSAPTLLDGSKSLDVDEEKIRKKTMLLSNIVKSFKNSPFYYVLSFQVMGQHLLVFIEEEFFFENLRKCLRTTNKLLELTQ